MIANNGMYGVKLGLSKADTVYVLNKQDAQRIRNAVKLYEDEVGKQGFKTLSHLANYVIEQKGAPLMDVVVSFDVIENKRVAGYPR